MRDSEREVVALSYDFAIPWVSGPTWKRSSVRAGVAAAHRLSAKGSSRGFAWGDFLQRGLLPCGPGRSTFFSRNLHQIALKL